MMKVNGKISIISGLGVPKMGTFEETVVVISEILGVNLQKSDTEEFSPFNAYSAVVLGLTIVLLDTSIFGVKEYYEFQVYGGSDDEEKTWVDISEFLISFFEHNLSITCRKL
jgi:hypothetical protein